MTNKILARPQLYLLLLIGVVFGLHAGYVLSSGGSLNEALFWQAYLFNTLAAEIILTVMLRMAPKKSDYLGFVFMGGSLLKFLVFFLAFYPVYKEDGTMEVDEFMAFFIPYLVALSFKSYILLKSLNQS